MRSIDGLLERVSMNRRAASLFLVFALAACGGRTETPQPADPAATATAATPPAQPPTPPALAGPSGTIIGIVRLADGAEVPSWPAQAMPHPPGSQVQRPDLCGPPKLTDTQSARLDAANRGLSGVLVAPSDFDRAPTPVPATHQVAIRGCTLDPPFLVATLGDTLHLTNATNYPFLPTGGEGPGITQALMKDQTRDFSLDRVGPRTIGCNAFGLACGRTDVMTMAHPLHAVTARNGSYRIENVPANQDLRLHAWNPLFRETVVPVRLAAGETKTIDIVLTPAPIQVQPEVPTTPRDPREGDIY